jgi:hypothetical protein
LFPVLVVLLQAPIVPLFQCPGVLLVGEAVLAVADFLVAEAAVAEVGKLILIKFKYLVKIPDILFIIYNFNNPQGNIDAMINNLTIDLTRNFHENERST